MQVDGIQKRVVENILTINLKTLKKNQKNYIFKTLEKIS